jgi:phage/plasmid-like protein (TIGR03299 family)
METNLMTASEVLVNHGLSFKVVESPIYDNVGRELKSFKAIQREDNGHAFQVSKDGYKIIQNSEALSVLDEVVGSGMAKYSGAKSFKNGAVNYIRADVPQLDATIAGEKIKAYIYAIASHDGSITNRIFVHQQRLICQNLITHGKVQTMFCFKHTENYRVRIQDAIEVFAQYRSVFVHQQRQFEAMASAEMSRLELDSFLNQLLSVKVEKKENSTRVLNQKAELAYLFDNGIGHHNIRGTRWAAYNAVCQYIDHERSSKGEDSNREYSSMFGSGANLRDKAFELLEVR